MEPMTQADILKLMGSELPLNRARRAFAAAAAKIQQASQQRHSLNPFEQRRMEFEAVRQIAAELGVTI